MASYNKISQKASDWVSVNTLSSVTVGDAFTIQNNNTEVVLVSEGITKPTLTADNYLKLYSAEYAGLSLVNVTSGSGQIWVRPASLGDQIELSIQG